MENNIDNLVTFKDVMVEIENNLLFVRDTNTHLNGIYDSLINPNSDQSDPIEGNNCIMATTSRVVVSVPEMMLDKLLIIKNKNEEIASKLNSIERLIG